MFREIEERLWQDAMVKGGFGEAIIRIVIAVTRANKVYDIRQYRAAEKCLQADPRLAQLKSAEVRQMVKEQSAILEKDEEMALESLRKLLPTRKDREKALEVAFDIAESDLELHDEEIIILDKVQKILLPIEGRA